MTDQTRSPARNPISQRAVVLPAVIACALALILGTVGFFAVGFGMSTTCTDWFETGHHCDALHVWLGAGAIGQLAIGVASALLLALGTTLARRRLIAILAWALIPLSVAWITITSILGRNSFKC